MKLVRNVKFMAFSAMVLLSAIACKKETIEDPIQDPTPTTQTQVKKGELVRINFPAGVSQPEFTGTIGGISISLLRETPNDVIFLVPTSLPTGNQELLVPALNNFAFTYEVSEAQLSQPVSEIIADLNTQFANYSATLGTSESDLFVQQGLAQYTTFINSTSEENKQIIATVYALNKSYIDGIINEDFSGVGKSNAWTLTKFAFAVSALGGGSWMLICGVGVEKAVGAVVAYIAFGKARNYLSELRDDGVFQVNLAIGGDLGDVNKNRADTLQYSPGQTVQTTIALAGRKITAGDANQGNNNLASFFNSFGGYNWYVDKANAALTWVNDNILFANFNLIQVETLPAESPTNQNSISNEEFQNLNLSFGSGLLSISNLTYLGSGNVQFKANFSGQPSQLPVVTKLNFSLPGFFNTISGSFDVKVGEGDSTAIYQQAVQGNWTVTNEDQTTHNLIIYANGYGRYWAIGSDWANYSGIDENGNAYWDISWEIQKHNGRYFLRDFGFWHFGYESNRTFDVSLTGNYLNYPTTSFKTYVDFGTPSQALLYQKN